VSVLLIATTDHGAAGLSTSGCPGNIPRVQKPPHSRTEESATPPHVHPNSRYVTTRDELYQALPCISAASDKPWGERAWVRG